MIYKNAKTVWVAEDNFQIPGSDLTIYTIKLEIDGSRDMYKTMSSKIAAEGWGGDIELYTNAKGKEYVRQAPKDDYQAPAPSGTTSTWTDKQPEIKAEWAIGQAINMGKAKSWEELEQVAKKLFAMVDRVKVGNPPTSEGYEKFTEVKEQIQARVEAKKETKTPPTDAYGNTDEYVLQDISDEINLSDIPF